MGLKNWFRSWQNRRRQPIRGGKRSRDHKHVRLAWEQLEDRITPSFDVTISAAATSNGSFALSGAVEVFTPNATGANASVTDIQNFLDAGTSVTITTTGAGGEAGNITLLDGVTQTAGAVTPTLFLNADGSIDDSSASTVTVTNLALQASTGIAVTGDLQTQVSGLVAQTSTGGIFVNNTGGLALAIGFSGDPFQGVTDTVSDDISITNNADINIIASGEIIEGAGNVTVTTTGASNIQTGGAANSAGGASGGSIVSTGGVLTVTAGQDVLIGQGGGLTGGDLQGSSDVVVSAGRNFILDGAAVDAHGAGTVTITAGANPAVGNITLNSSSPGGRITTEGGAITLTTGAGGTFTANAQDGLGDVRTTGTPQAVTTPGGGPITINADQVTLTDPVSINGGLGGVVTITTFTASEIIDVGSKTAGELGLTDMELSDVTTGNMLQIGDLNNAGGILVTQTVGAAASGNYNSTLSLVSGGSIGDDGTTNLVVPRLAATASTGILFTQTAGTTDFVAQTDSGGIQFASQAATLTVGFAGDPFQGVSDTTSGDIVLSASGPNGIRIVSTGEFIQGAGNVTITAPGGVNLNLGDGGASTVVSAAGDVTITTNNLTLLDMLDAGGTALFQSDLQSVDLGTDTLNGRLVLTDATLNEVTATTLEVSEIAATSANPQNIYVSGPFDQPFSVGTLYVAATSFGAIIENTGTITGTNLALQAINGIGDIGAGNAVVTQVSNLVAQTNQGGTYVTNTGDLTVGFAGDPFQGIGTSTPTPGDIVLTDTGSVNVNFGASEGIASAGNVTVSAGGDISVSGGASITTQGGNISLTTGTGGTFTASGGNATGDVNSTSAGGNGNITIVADAVNFSDSPSLVAGSGTVSITTATASEVINLGTANAGQLGLTDAELANVSTTSLVQIGSNGVTPAGAPANLGGILLTQDIGAVSPGNYNNTLSLVTSGAISQSAGGVTMTNFAAQAGTGITLNSATNAVSNFVAQTATGGISLNNTGDLMIGFTGDPVQGVRGTGVSGDISVTTSGSITVTIGGENIQGPANVTVTATGATSNIQTGGFQEAIQNLGAGTVSLSAGQDIILGLPGSYGDVNANAFGDASPASAVLNAGRDISVQGSGDTNLDANNGGSVLATAGRNITVSADASGSQIFTDSGTINLQTAAAGAFALGDNGSIFSTNSGTGADITISADSMSISTNVTLIDSGTGNTTLQQAGTTTQNIDLGTASAGNLGLTSAELAQITAGVLRIGRTDNAGNISITNTITAGPGYNTLSLLTGGEIDNNTVGTDLIVTNIALQAVSGIGENDVGTLQLQASTLAVANSTNHGVYINNVGDLSITTVDGVSGVSNSTTVVSFPPDITVTTVGSLTISNNVTTGAGTVDLEADNPESILTNNAVISNTLGFNITLVADKMALAGGTINCAGGRVTLQSFTAGNALNLGSTVDTTPNTLELSSAELNTITTNATLQIGDGNAGDISVSATITISKVDTLDLESGGAAVDGNGSALDIQVNELTTRTANGVSLDTAVSNLAFVNSSAGAVSFRNTGALTISTPDGQSFSNNFGTTTDISASSPITIAADITSAGTLTVTTAETASEAGVGLPAPDDDITLIQFVTVESTGGDVNLDSADGVTVPAAASVISDTGTASVVADFGGGDLDNDAGLTLPGSISGANIFLSAPQDISLSTLTATGGTIQVTSSNGAIVDATPPGGTLIMTGNLALAAANGIGSSADPLLTTVANLVTEITNAGDTYISNTGDLNIGFAGDPFQGVTGGIGGDIGLTTTGSITITTAGEFVSGPNNVTINAGMDVTTGGSQVAITGGATGINSGMTTVIAGGNINLGLSGNLSGSIVSDDGDIVLTATTGNIVVDGDSVVQNNGNGNITATAGGSITMVLDGALAGPQFSTLGLDINLTTGSGGTFTAASAGEAVASNGGNITISADDMVISAGIDAGAGVVTLQQATTTAQSISIGGGALGLGLSDAELAQVTAAVLRIGRSDNAGSIVVDGNVTAHAGYGVLHLVSNGGDISESGGATLAVTSLAAEAGFIDLDSSGNTIGNLAGTTSEFIQFGFDVVDSIDLNVTTVDGVVGIQGINSLFGDVVLTGGAGNLLTVSQPIGTTNGRVFLTFDDMAINSTITAPSLGVFAGLEGLVVLNTASAGQVISVGTNTPGTLGLTEAELDNNTAGVLLTIGGNSNTGGINVTAAVSQAGSGWSTLQLDTAGAITNGGGSLTVTNLDILSGTGAAVTTTVSNLDFNNSTSGAVSISNTGALTITNVAGAGNAVNNGTTTDLSASSPITFAVNTTSAGTLTATTAETGTEVGLPLPPPDDDITVNSGITVQSTGGDVNLQSADSVVLQATSSVQASGTASLIANFGGGDLDSDASLTLSGTITAPNITLSQPGDFNVGQLSATGTISITSTNGAILDQDPPAGVDITAANLALSAATGIGGSTGVGTGADSELETHVSNLVAQTTTGGIFISNSGAPLTIGFAGDPFQGVKVATSGDIALSNTSGNINVTLNRENVVGPDKVSVATVTSGNITTGGGNAAPAGAVRSTGGDVTLSAAQNLFIGDTSTTKFGNVETAGTGNVVLQAGGNINVDEFSFVEARGTGDITATAGGNISLLHTHFGGAQIDTAGGTINLTTGAGGVFTANATAPPNIFSTFGGASGGNITVKADNMVINDTISAGTAAVTLEQATAATTVNITIGGGASGLGLSDAELGRITAGVLRIGRADNAGNITADGNVTTHAGYSTLDLISGGTISQAGGSLSVSNLAAQGTGGVNLGTIANTVTALAGSTSNHNFSFLNSTDLTISTVDGVSGISAGTGSVAVTLNGLDSTLTNNASISGSSATLTADRMILGGGTINVGSGAGNIVVLEPKTADRPVNLDNTAGDPTGELRLSQSELNTITAGIVRIGDLNITGNITVKSAITPPAGSFSLETDINGLIAQNLGASLTATNLQASGAVAVTLTDPGNTVGQISGASLGAFSFADSIGVMVGTVDSFAGIETGGPISLTVRGSGNLLTVNRGIDSHALGGTGAAVNLSADNMALNAAVSGGATGIVTLTATSPAQVINLGGADSPTQLGLTDAELGEVTGQLLRIGTAANTGGIQVSAAGIGTTNAANYGSTLSLITGGTISQTGPGTLTIANLAAQGAGGVNLNTNANTVTTLAGTTSNKNFNFLNSGSFSVGTVDGIIGVSAGTGAVALTASGLGSLLTVGQAISGLGITLTGDSMNVNAGVNGGAAAVILEPFTANDPINIGTKPGSSLGLLQAELNRITTSVGLVIGGLAVTGDIKVTSAVTSATTGFSTLSFLTQGSVSQGPGATITVPSFFVVGGPSVNLPEANNVNNLEGATINLNAPFTFTDTASVNIGAVTGTLGITTNRGDIAVNDAAGTTITVTIPLDTTNGGGNTAGASISLAADQMNLNAAVNGGTGGIVTLAAVGQAVDLAPAVANARLDLSQTALNQVSAGVLRIVTNAGNLLVSGAISAPATVGTLSLIAGNTYGIIENGGTITSSQLALQAVAGIGDGTTLQVVGPVSLAFNNAAGSVAASGNVQIHSTGALTIAAEDGVNTSSNGATGGTTSLSAASPLVFAVSTSSNGTLSASTTESALPESGPDDDITVNAGVTVSSTTGDVDFTAADSIITQVGSTIQALAGTVNLVVGVGDTDNDATLILNGTVNAANQNFTTPGDFIVTSLSAAGTITINAGGAIIDQDPPAGVDITANSLALTAGTGIATSGDPLETQVNNLEAQTATGGIFITNGVTNPTTLNIGGVSGALSGVRVTGASGDIALTNAGSIDIITNGEIVKGPADVTVQTNGPLADVVTGGGNQFANGDIVSTGGTVAVQAGRDVLIGNPPGGPGNRIGDVQGGGSIVLSAGRDITIDCDSFVDAHGTGTVTATAGNNISLAQTGITGARITTQGGAVSLTTGAGGIFSADSGNGTVASNGGAISIAADDMVLNIPVNAGTGTPGSGGIVTLTTVTPGQVINLGTNPAVAGSQLGLTDAELGEVTASLLRLGGAANTGGIQITAAGVGSTMPANYNNTLSLITSGTIAQSGAGTLTITNLALQAAAVAMDSIGNQNNVTNLAANVTGAGGLDFRNNLSLTVTGPIDGISGITATAGPITLGEQSVGGLLTVNNPIAATNTNIMLFFDSMNLAAAVSAGTARVQLDTGFETFGRAIDIGTNTPGDLGLTQAELNRITAGVLQIGTTFDSAGITISAAITAPATWSTLSVQQGAGTIAEGANGSLQVTNLALTGAGMTLTNAANHVPNLAFNNSAGAVAFTSAGGLTITTVDGLTSSTNTGTTTNLTAASPLIFAVNTSSAGTLTAITDESAQPEAGPEDNITVNAGVTVQSTGGDVDFTAADAIILTATGLVTSGSATGTVNLVAGVGDDDNDASITVPAGTITAANITINTPGNFTINTLTATNTISITATGSILDSDPPADTDITATNLALSAGTGITTSGEPLETQVSNLVAQTATGGIFISNTGAFTVGFAGDAIHGVKDTGASGDIVLSTTGALNVNFGASEVVSGPANVTLNAASMTLGENIGAGATAVLNATTGGINQTGGGVTATSLLLTGSGAFTLNAAGNHTGTFAASITAPSAGLSYTDSGSTIIGTVNAVNGVSTPGPVTITVAAGLTVSQPLVSTTGAVVVNQGATGGTVTIDSTVNGTTVNVNGGPASDTLLVDFTAGASLPAGLSYQGNGGTNLLTVNDAGSNVAHTYTVSSTAAVRDTTTINYASVNTLTVNGGNLGDTFNVTPSATTAYTLNGNPPAANPNGDTLNLNGQGNNVAISQTTPGNGSIAVSSNQSISYSSIENITITNAGLKVIGTVGADTLTVTATNVNSGSYVFDGGPTVNFSGALNFDFEGNGGGDTFNVVNPTSGPATLFAPTGGVPSGIIFNAGGGGILNIFGGSETTATYTYNPDTVSGHDGTIQLVSPTAAATYTYSGLMPITNTGTVSNIIFNLPQADGDNQAILKDDGTANNNMSELASGNSTFETTIFTDPSSSLTLNSGNDGETVTLGALDAQFSAPTININGGTGADRFNVQATPASAVTTWNGGGNTDTVKVGSLAPTITTGTLAGIKGVLTLSNAGGSNAVSIDDSGDASAESASLITLAGLGQLTGLGNPAAINCSLASTRALTINGTNNGDTFTIFQTAAAGLAFTTSFNTGTGGDTFNVQDTSANVTYLVQGQGAADTVNVGSQTPNLVGGNLSGINGAVIVANKNPGLSDVNIDDSGDAISRTATLNTSTTLLAGQTVGQLLGLDNAAPIVWDIKDLTGFNDIATVTINAGAGGNTFTVDQTNQPGFDATNLAVDLNSGTGKDTINIQATSAAFNLEGEGSADVVNVGSLAPTIFGGTLAGITGAVTIANDAALTTINIDDSGDGSSRSATINTFLDLATLQSFEQLTNLGNTAPIAWNINDGLGNNDTGAVTIFGGSGGNTFLVNATAQPGTGGNGLSLALFSGIGTDTVNVQATNAPLTIQGTNGSDTVNVGSLAPTLSGGTLANINGAVTIANADLFTTVNIDDSGDTSSRSAALDTVTTGGQTYDRLTGLGNPAAITWDINDAGGNNDIGAVTINGGSHGNSYLVNQVALPGNAASHLSVTLDSGTGADTVNIKATNAPLTVQGQGGADTVNVGSLAPATSGGTLSGINGGVVVENSTGSSTLNIDDSGAAAASAAVLLNTTTSAGQTFGNLTALDNPGTISWDINDGTHSEVSALTINAGSHGNTIGVDNTLPAGSAFTTTLNSGAGSDTVNIQATSTNNSLVVQGQSGSDTVDLGSFGSVQSILGEADIENTGGSTAITADDSADTAARNVTFSSFAPNPADTEHNNDVYGQISGLAPANINYEFKDTASLAVDGSSPAAGGDTFNVNATGPTFTTTVNGGSGNDVFNITGAGLGAGSTDVFNGNAGNDTFNVSAATNAAIQVNGGPPTVAPGDSLNVDGQDNTVNIAPNGVGSGTVSVSGHQSFAYTGIEGLGISNACIQVNGTAATDLLTVTATNSNSGSYVLNADPTINFSNATCFDFFGNGGGDTFIIHNPAGSLFAPVPDGITYSAGGGAASLFIDGGAETTATYNYSPDNPAGQHNGTFDLVNGALDANYTFSGMGGVLSNADTVTSIVMNLPQSDGNNQPTLQDDAVAANSRSELTSGNNTFQNTIFTDPSSTLTLNTGNDGETVTLKPLDSAFLAILKLNGGTSADTFNIQATPAGTRTNIVGGGGADTANVTNAGLVQAVAGTLNIENPTGTIALAVDDSADVTGRSVVLTTFAPNPNDSEGNADAYGRIAGLGSGNINYELDDMSAVTLSAGNAVNTFTINQTAPSATSFTTTISTGTAADTVNIQAASSGVTYAVVGQGGANTVNLGNAGSAQGIQGNVILENPGGSNTITAADTADTSPRTVTLTSLPAPFAGDSEGNADVYGQISGLAPANVSYEFADTAGLTISGGSGGNHFIIQNTGPNFTTTLNTGNGNDTVDLGNSGTLDGIQGPLVINGQGSLAAPTVSASTVCPHSSVTVTNAVGDTLNFNDQQNGLAATYTLTSTTVQRTGAGLITFSNIQTIGLSVGQASDIINVLSTPASSNVTVSTTAGADNVAVTSTGAHSILTVNGDVAASQITLQSTGATSVTQVLANAGNTVTVQNTGTGAGVDLVAGAGAETLNLQAAATGSTIHIAGGTGSAQVNIGSVANTLDTILATDICVDGAGAPGVVTLNINDQGSAAAHLYTLDGSTFRHDGGNLIDYSTIQFLTLNGGSGGNNVAVQDTALGTDTTLNTGAGSDTATVLNTSDTLNIQGQSGTDTLTLSNGGSVQGILGNVNIENSAGFTRILVDDSTDANVLPGPVVMGFIQQSPSDSELNSDPYGDITGLAPGTINYEFHDTSSITVKTGSGGFLGAMEVDVLATGTLTNLIADGPTTVNVGGDPLLGAQEIQHTLNIENPAGAFNTLSVDDSANAANTNVSIGIIPPSGQNPNDSESNTDPWGQIVGLAPAHINYEYADTESLTLTGGTGDNTFTVLSTTLVGQDIPTTINTGAGGQDMVFLTNAAVSTVVGQPNTGTLVLNGQATTNSLFGPNLINTWSIDGPDSGSMTALPAVFNGFQNISGGTAEDVFQFTIDGNVDGVLDGGTGGRNWLDYSLIPFPFSIHANLTTGDVALVGFEVNIQNVIGSASGGDLMVGSPQGGVLVAHNGNNSLTAGTGPGVLIGGFGKNFIRGSNSSDLIINGSTSYDANIPALDMIFSEWALSGLSYAARVSKMKNAKSFADPLIYGQTVQAFQGTNGGIGPRFGRGGFIHDSTLIGGPGLDWFFTGNPLDVVDPQPGEIITSRVAPDPVPTLTTYASHTGSVTINLAGADFGGTTPTAITGIAAPYDVKRWSAPQTHLKNVSFSYSPLTKNLTITYPATFVGTLQVYLYDSQGATFTTFLVSAGKNLPPTMTAVANQTMARGATTLTINNFQLNDPNGDAVTLKAIVTGYSNGPGWTATTATPPGFAVIYDPVHKKLVITKPAGYTGTFQVTLMASDGIVSVQKSFQIKAK